MKIGREAAKQMFRDDKNSQGCYRSVITKIDKIYDSLQSELKEKDEQIEGLEEEDEQNTKDLVDSVLENQKLKEQIKILQDGGTI